jgi:hypothetical protein
MRVIVFAAAAFALAAAANARPGQEHLIKPPPGPYKLDAKGVCHAANGVVVPLALCKPPSPPKP